MATKPEQPTERMYDYLTGEQWFTQKYRDPQYDPYWDPFTAGGTPWEELATKYAGLPVVSGYYQDEQFYPEQSLYNQASQLYDLRETDLPGFEDWMSQTGAPYQADLTQTQPYQDIQTLTGEFADVSDEMAGAWESAARAMGFFNADGSGDVNAYQSYLTSTREQKEAGVMGQEGIMGTEYETAARRAAGARVNQIVEANQQMIEALGTRSSAAAYSKMGEVSNMIQDELLQSDMKLLEQDLLMRQIEYEALLARSEQAQATGMAAGEQYMNMLVNNRMMALQSYSTQLDTIMKNNQQTLQQYGMELERITAHADITYKSIMAEIGYDESQMQLSEDRYNQYMMPYYDALDAWYQEELIRQGDEANRIAAEEAGATDWLGYMGTGAIVGAAAGGPIGAVIGTLVGFVAATVTSWC